MKNLPEHRIITTWLVKKKNGTELSTQPGRKGLISIVKY